MTEKLRPFRPISPGEMLEDALRTIPVRGPLAKIVDEIINKKRVITPVIAVKLARAFGTSKEFWLNLEACYRLDLQESLS